MKSIFKQNFIWVVSLILLSFSFVYWFFLATDKYETTAVVVLESPQVSAGISMQSILTGSSASTEDMLLLREFLLSYDMMDLVSGKYRFFDHYRNESINIFSRLGEHTTNQENYEYYRDVITVELDDYSKVLKLKVSSYDPVFSKEILEFIIIQGEKKMNELGRDLAQDQVDFLEKQVEELNERLYTAEQTVLDYQNKHLTLSPSIKIENIENVVSVLEQELSKKKSELKVLLSYQSDSSPSVKSKLNEIKALENQILEERNKTTNKYGNALNNASSEFEMLKLKAEFAKDNYSSALMALENTRIESIRKLKKLSILQNPILLKESNAPDRFYNFFLQSVFILLALISNMIFVIIKEHKD
jgi:capsular polysaccharide transport system permease protein